MRKGREEREGRKRKEQRREEAKRDAVRTSGRPVPRVSGRRREMSEQQVPEMEERQGAGGRAVRTGKGERRR